MVARAPAAFRARFGFAALGPWIGKLKRAGERLRLRDGRGQLVDAVDYEAGFPGRRRQRAVACRRSRGFRRS